MSIEVDFRAVIVHAENMNNRSRKDDGGIETRSREDPSKRESKREKNPAAVALGRLGGLKGGKARAEKLSAARRNEIAKKAAQARWLQGSSPGR